MKKKRKGWLIVIIIAVVLLVLLGLWILGDDEDYYEDDYYSTERDEYHSSGSSGSFNTVDNTTVHTPPTVDEAIRDKMVSLKGDGNDRVTILVYMNGSDLESEDGEATTDLSEMIAAGSSDKVNVLVETLGTRKWSSKFGISSKTAQRYRLDGKGLTLVQDDLGKLNCGAAEPLTDFIKWGVSTYPADRYILMMWDHGGGPVYGFGYDDRTESEDSLSMAEMQKALGEAGTVFDFIGMDCCIMSSIETACALYDFCDYMILSEDFESGEGWSYTGWLKALYNNTSISTPDLGKIIVDDMVSVNSRAGENAILTVIDQSHMKLLYSSWVNFAYANEDTLLGTNYSRKKPRKSGYRVSPVLERNNYFKNSRGIWDLISGDDASMSEYYVTDIMAVAENITSEESEALSSALNDCIVYMKACGESSDLTGFSVTLPYGDAEFYDELKGVFTGCGFDEGYVAWLGSFVDSSNADSFFDYGSWDSLWSGWDDYEDDYDWDDWDEDWYDDYYDSDYYDSGYYYDDYDDGGWFSDLFGGLFGGWFGDDDYYDDQYDGYYDDYDDYYDDDEYYDDEYYYDDWGWGWSRDWWN